MSFQSPILRGPIVFLGATGVAIAALLLVYSQSSAFIWDDGFHLLAAQLIAHGKRPYLDFCFPQVPLNAFWNALWMRILGESWRAVHGAALMIGFHAATVEYATLAQAYALCGLLLVAAFRTAVAAVERPGWRMAAAAGFLASAAAASSLLVAAAPVVLLAWMWRKGRRADVGAFLAAAVVPFLPVVWLFAQAPRTVLFNLFEYQLVYRRANWDDATPHDWKVLTTALRSPQPMILVLLAAAGLWFVAKRSGWDGSLRAEYYLSGWMALGIGAELAATHPTFDWYFVVVIPFLAIPAAAGLYALDSRMPPWLPAAAFAVLFAGLFSGLGARTLYRDRVRFTWRMLEAVAAKVNQVTPPGRAIWADEHIYFLTRRPPAEGTEFSYAEVIDRPPPRASAFHVVYIDELDRQAAAGRYYTVETCEEKEQIDDLELPRLFRHSAAVETCHVFWDPAGGIP
jgi:hypothetical protein